MQMIGMPIGTPTRAIGRGIVNARLVGGKTSLPFEKLQAESATSVFGHVSSENLLAEADGELSCRTAGKSGYGDEIVGEEATAPEPSQELKPIDVDVLLAKSGSEYFVDDNWKLTEDFENSMEAICENFRRTTISKESLEMLNREIPLIERTTRALAESGLCRSQVLKVAIIWMELARSGACNKFPNDIRPGPGFWLPFENSGYDFEKDTINFDAKKFIKETIVPVCEAGRLGSILTEKLLEDAGENERRWMNGFSVVPIRRGINSMFKSQGTEGLDFNDFPFSYEIDGDPDTSPLFSGTGVTSCKHSNKGEIIAITRETFSVSYVLTQIALNKLHDFPFVHRGKDGCATFDVVSQDSIVRAAKYYPDAKIGQKLETKLNPLAMHVCQATSLGQFAATNLGCYGEFGESLHSMKVPSHAVLFAFFGSNICMTQKELVVMAPLMPQDSRVTIELEVDTKRHMEGVRKEMDLYESEHGGPDMSKVDFVSQAASDCYMLGWRHGSSELSLRLMAEFVDSLEGTPREIIANILSRSSPSCIEKFFKECERKGKTAVLMKKIGDRGQFLKEVYESCKWSNKSKRYDAGAMLTLTACLNAFDEIDRKLLLCALGGAPKYAIEEFFEECERKGKTAALEKKIGNVGKFIKDVDEREE